MKQQSIYPVRSQEVVNFFTSGISPEKLLIVPIDWAKADHTAQFCRGNGEFLLTEPLVIYNTVAGADYLEKRIQGICRKYRISRHHVLIGGEDPPTYVVNFVQRLKAREFKVVRVNAYEAKRYRTNSRASSDRLDLHGIAQALIHRRARDLEVVDEIYSALKGAARARHRLVCQETALKSRIHQSVDVLCPGFLSERQSGLVPFATASLWLLEENFSAVKIKRMRLTTLVEGLRRHHTLKAEETAQQLKTLADHALAPPAALIDYTSRSLATQIKLFRQVREALAMEETEMARCLIQTPGFYFTSIPGIGVVIAGGMVAEYGDPRRWPRVDQMASYGGIVPRQEQSGGVSQAPVKGHLPKDCNRFLKNWLLQGAYHAGTTPHPWGKLPEQSGDHQLLEHYRQVENREGKSRLSTAKLMLKIVGRMVRDERIYLPATWIKQPAPSDADLISYLNVVNRALAEKWQGYDLSGIPDERNYFLKWKEYTDELTRTDNPS